MAKTPKTPKKCGTCVFWSMWTGTCCEGGDFREFPYDHPACQHWDKADDYE